MRNAVLILSLLILFLSCSSKSDPSPSEYSDSLILLNKASNVRYAKLNGTDQVSYKIAAQYPANETISELNLKLKSKGWKPLEKDWLNPKIPTSHARGWTRFLDQTKAPNVEVHSWNSCWTNSQEDILTYGLVYSYPIKAAPEMMDLKITAIYIPQKLAKASVAQILEHKKSFEKTKGLR
jgi:hypothetical protein